MGLELVVRPFIGRSIAPERVPTPTQKPQDNVQVRVECSASKPMVYSWWTVAEFKIVDGSHSEIALKTEVVRVRNPEDPEGELREVSVTYVPYLGPGGQAQGYYAMLTDLGPQRRIATQEMGATGDVQQQPIGWVEGGERGVAPRPEGQFPQRRSVGLRGGRLQQQFRPL